MPVRTILGTIIRGRKLKWHTAIPMSVFGAITMVTAQSPPSRMCVQLSGNPTETVGGGVVQGVGKISCRWNKANLKVRFLDGTPFVQSKVRENARLWTQYSGVSFDFVSSERN